MSENLPVIAGKRISPDEDESEFLRVVKLKAEGRSIPVKLSETVAGMGSGVMRMLPDAFTERLASVSEKALRTAYLAGDEMPAVKGYSRFIAGASGAVSGFFGMPGMLVDVPLTTAVIMRAVRAVAREYGEDTKSPECKMACLEVFGMNSGNDDENGGYWGARAAVTSAALDTAITAIASRFSMNLSGKFASMAVPVTGAAAGALINYAFTEHYIKMAHIHFAVRKLERTYGFRETRRKLREAADKIR